MDRGLLDKAAFIQQYVLNRANIVDNLDGVGAAEIAAKTWDVIQELSKPKAG